MTWIKQETKQKLNVHDILNTVLGRNALLIDFSFSQVRHLNTFQKEIRQK